MKGPATHPLVADADGMARSRQRRETTMRQGTVLTAALTMALLVPGATAAQDDVCTPTLWALPLESAALPEGWAIDSLYVSPLGVSVYFVDRSSASTRTARSGPQEPTSTSCVCRPQPSTWSRSPAPT